MKKPVKRFLIVLSAILGALLAAVAVEYLWKGSPGDVIPGTVEILAHRGVHQNYDPNGGIDRLTGCEASRIYPPSHGYIENTIEAISAAIAMGATIVEVDIRRTADSNLVIMHDWALECRTNGTGKISERTVEYLKTLDMGYGYTADNGMTFPLRGKGIGKIVTFDELMASFRDTTFLLDHKDFDERSTEILMDLLADYPAERRARIYHWGDKRLFAKIRARYPEMRQLMVSRENVMNGLLPYLFSFGLIPIPSECAGLMVPIPAKYVKFLWGWPYRFISGAHKYNMKIFLYIDTKEDAIAFKDLPVDGFLTDYIEVTGEILAGGTR